MIIKSNNNDGTKSFNSSLKIVIILLSLLIDKKINTRIEINVGPIFFETHLFLDDSKLSKYT